MYILIEKYADFSGREVPHCPSKKNHPTALKKMLVAEGKR